MNLETRADFLLWRKGWPKDVLTEGRLRVAYSHETYTPHPIGSIRTNGMYRRAYARRDKRPTNRRRYTADFDPWHQDAWESFK